MSSLLRIGVVVVSLIAAAASATAPKSHVVERAATVPLDFEATWTALVDLFAERGWAIQQISKDSGLITTDWMRLDADADEYTDCGGAGIASIVATQVSFNVRVKPVGATTEVMVNTKFRQLRTFDGISRVVECTSKGAVEAMIQARLSTPSRSVRPADPQHASAFWCALGDGACTMAEASCTAPCRKLDDVWCARYKEAGRTGYLCGSTEGGCQALASSRLRKSTEMGLCKPVHAATPSAAAPTPPRPAPPTPPVPRGFFCATSASSPGAGFCTREKADCQRARDAALAAVADLGECRLVESAFCFTADGSERCAPTPAGCAARATSTNGATACDERK